MEMSRVKDGNYYVVQSFMVKDLKLKGLEKDVYAIIYGFSQAEDQTFTGSLQYLADWTCASKQAIMNALKKLVDKQLLIKKEKFVNNVKFVEYSPTDWTSIQENCTGVSKKIAQVVNNVDGGIQENCIPPIQETCTNNLDYNLIDNKGDNISNNIELDKRDKEQACEGAFSNGSPSSFSDEEDDDEPNFYTQLLIQHGYIGYDDDSIGDYNRFLNEVNAKHGTRTLSKVLKYFLDRFDVSKGKDENGNEIGSRLAYFKTSIENGLRRLKAEYDLASIPEGLSWLLR